MRKLASVLFLVWIGGSHAHARDVFDKVRCDGDIVKALVGQHDTDNRPVMASEARHKDLGLEDLGASDYGTFSSITWLICGREYMLLQGNRTGVIHDALQVPPHAKENPWFEGFCKRKGKLMENAFVGILRDDGRTKELAAEMAWEVDPKMIKFVKVSTDDLLCQRDGILEPR